jgi:hypothetical protein
MCSRSNRSSTYLIPRMSTETPAHRADDRRADDGPSSAPAPETTVASIEHPAAPIKDPVWFIELPV